MRTKKIKISSPDDYFDVLGRIEDGEDDGTPDTLAEDGVHWISGTMGKLERAAREYLLSLSPMQRQQLMVHAPNDFLRSEHEDRIDKIDGRGGWRHRQYLYSLAGHAGVRPNSCDSDEELKTAALAGAVMLQRHKESWKQRIKENGRLVQCQECARHFYSSDTERIKPYGATRYQRFCKACAEKVNEAKRIYQALNRNGRKKS